MNKHLRGFILAISFMTILPVTRNHHFEDDDLAISTIYFPVVGFLLGLLVWGIFWLLNSHLPLSVTIFIILLFLTFITGAFHEDALGDVFDGFGGGYTKERILEIMKDSRIGAYGSVALIFLILGKYIFLTEINAVLIPKAILVALVLSRWSSVVLFRYLEYPQRATGTGRSFATNIQRLSPWSLLLSGLFTIVLAVSIFGIYASTIILSATLGMLVIAYFYFKKRINAYTGDCAGAVLSISELLTYFVVMVL